MKMLYRNRTNKTKLIAILQKVLTNKIKTEYLESNESSDEIEFNIKPNPKIDIRSSRLHMSDTLVGLQLQLCISAV